MAKISDDTLLELLKAGGDTALSATGATALGGRKSVLGKILDTLNNLVKQQAEQDKPLKERAKYMEMSATQLKILEKQKEALDELQDFMEAEKAAGYQEKKAPSASVIKAFQKMSKESIDSHMEAAKMVSGSVDSLATAVKDQPKRMSDEVKKAGIADKFLSAVKGGFREIYTGERRKGAIQTVLAATGLQELEDVFGVSERVEDFFKKRKEEKEKNKKKEEEEIEKARLMEISVEDYRTLAKASEDWKKRVAASKARKELGQKGFEDVEKWEAEQKKKEDEDWEKELEKRGFSSKGKTRGLLTEGGMSRDLTPEITAGLTEGLKEGISKELEAVSGHLEKVVEHTEGTRDEVRDLKSILTGSVDKAVKDIVRPIEEQKKATEQIAENTEKTKEAVEEGKKDKDKLGFKDIVQMLTGGGGVSSLLDKIPGVGGAKKLLGGAGRLLAPLATAGGLATAGAGLAAGFGVHQLVQTLRGKETVSGQFGESIFGQQAKAREVEMDEKAIAQEAKLRKMEERNRSLRDKGREGGVPPPLTEEQRVQAEIAKEPIIFGDAQERRHIRDKARLKVKAQMAEAGEGGWVKTPTGYERAMGGRAATVVSQRDAAKAAGLLPATTESQKAMGLTPGVEQAPDFVMSRPLTAEEKAKAAAVRERLKVKAEPGPEVMQVPGPTALGEKKTLEKPVIVAPNTQSGIPQSTVQRSSYVDDLNIAITNQLMFQ